MVQEEVPNLVQSTILVKLKQLREIKTRTSSEEKRVQERQPVGDELARSSSETKE